MNLTTFQDCIAIDPSIMGGKAVIKGTRFTVAQLIAELANGRTLAQICEEFDLNVEVAKQCIDVVAATYDHPQGSWGMYVYFLALVAIAKDAKLKCECGTVYTDGEMCILCTALYALSVVQGESFVKGLR